MYLAWSTLPPRCRKFATLQIEHSWYSMIKQVSSSWDDESRFVDPIPDMLRCSICFNLVRDPRECIHCDKLFCSNCLSITRKYSNKCPNCQQNGHWKAMNRYLREITYDHIKIRCCNPDCDVISTVVDIAKHENICPFRRISCVYCLEILLLSQAEEHNSMCPKYPIECMYCKESIMRLLLEEHEEECDAPPAFHYWPYWCDDCHEPIEDLEHVSVCPYVKCRWDCCNKILLRDGTEEHESRCWCRPNDSTCPT